jgi:hypothetical protein
MNESTGRIIDRPCKFDELQQYNKFSCDFADRTCQGLQWSNRTPFDQWTQAQWAPRLNDMYKLTDGGRVPWSKSTDSL